MKTHIDVFDSHGGKVGMRALSIGEAARLAGVSLAPAPATPPKVGERPRWHIVLTEPNREATTHERLRARRYQPWAGFFRKRIRAGNWRQRREVTLPLFPGYLFLSIDPTLLIACYGELRTIAGLRGLMVHDERPVILPDAAIVAMMQKEAELGGDPPLPWKAGDRVEVMLADEWTSLIATVERLDDIGRIDVLAEMMGRAVKMTVPIESVRAVA